MLGKGLFWSSESAFPASRLNHCVTSVSNRIKNYSKAVNRENQPSTSGAGNSVGTRQATSSGNSLYLLLNWSVTWLQVPESCKKGLIDTLIAIIGFGYQILAGQQPRRGRKQLVPEIPPFRASSLAFNARRSERRVTLIGQGKQEGAYS